MPRVSEEMIVKNMHDAPKIMKHMESVKSMKCPVLVVIMSWSYFKCGGASHAATSSDQLNEKIV